MNVPDNSPLLPGADTAAMLMVYRWQRAHAELAADRVQRLRGLSEIDAARQFAELLQIRGPYPLRRTSGLVEQQRIFARLCQRT